MIAGAVAGIYALMRRPIVVQQSLGGNGIDPGKWLGDGAGTLQQYLAEIPSWAMDPAYIANVARNRYSNDRVPNDANMGAIPGYLTYNMMGGNNPYTVLADDAAHAGCGCGGGCGGGCPKPKCKPDCHSGVMFSDGAGMCLDSEELIPPYEMRYYG